MRFGIATLLSALLTMAALTGCDRMARERAAEITAKATARTAHSAAFAADRDTCGLCHGAPATARLSFLPLAEERSR